MTTDNGAAPVYVNVHGLGRGRETTLDIDALKIDPSYQYVPETEPGRITQLEKWLAERGGYDEGEAGRIHVNERKNGTYWIIDGGGRRWMSRRAGNKRIKVILFEHLTWEQEAKFFIDKNNKKRAIKQPHLFVVAAHAGIEPQATILPLVTAAGYALERKKGSRGAIIAPTSLLFAFYLGVEHLKMALYDMRHIWGDGETGDEHSGGVDGRLLVALAVIRASQPKVDQEHLRQVLKGQPAKRLVNIARQKASVDIASRNPQSRDSNPHLTWMIMGLYNDDKSRKGTIKYPRLDVRRIPFLKDKFTDERQYADVWRGSVGWH